MKFYSLLLLLPITFSCKHRSEEQASEAKLTTSVSTPFKERYKEFLNVLYACLANTEQASCQDNLVPGVILPLELEGGREGEEAGRLNDAFPKSKPNFLKCDSAAKACSLRLKRQGDSRQDLVLKTDSDKEDLSELIFDDKYFTIKMRLLDPGVGSPKKIEICRVGGLSATNIKTTKILRVEMKFDALKNLEPKGVKVTVDFMGGSMTDDCDFPGSNPPR
jgi:hypothetical protein